MQLFDERKKSIIRDIHSRKIRTILEFFVRYDLVEGRDSLGRILNILRNREKADTAASEFVTLLQWLEKENLVYVLEQHPDIVPKFEVYDTCSEEVWKEKPPQAKWLMARLSKYQGKEIIPSPDLTPFIDRDYKTFEQYRYEREEKKSRLYQFFTIGLATISIAVSVWTVKQQNNERSVTIKNSRAFPDTTVVKIGNLRDFLDTTHTALINQNSASADSLQSSNQE